MMHGSMTVLRNLKEGLSIRRFPALVQQHGGAAFDIIQTILTREWDDKDFYLYILDRVAVTADSCSNFAQQEWMLESALSHIKGSRLADAVVKAWLEILIAIVPLLPEHVVRAKILPIAMQKLPRNPASLRQRAISTVLLCTSACRLPSDETLWHKLLDACEDTEAPMRLCIASQLSRLIAATAQSPVALSELMSEVRHSINNAFWNLGVNEFMKTSS